MEKNKKWIWVCCQHPMPLLVQDRGIPDVLERIPPWVIRIYPVIFKNSQMYLTL